MSIGQNILLNDLRVNIPKHTTSIAPEEVLNAGAGGLIAISNSALVLKKLREAYAESLKGTFVLALVGTCLALPFAAGMQWLNIKTVAEERRSWKEVTRKDILVVSEAEVELREIRALGSSV